METFWYTKPNFAAKPVKMGIREYEKFVQQVNGVGIARGRWYGHAFQLLVGDDNVQSAGILDFSRTH